MAQAQVLDELPWPSEADNRRTTKKGRLNEEDLFGNDSEEPTNQHCLGVVVVVVLVVVVLVMVVWDGTGVRLGWDWSGLGWDGSGAVL